jgi:hypothetical protein
LPAFVQVPRKHGATRKPLPQFHRRIPAGN